MRHQGQCSTREDEALNKSSGHGGALSTLFNSADKKINMLDADNRISLHELEDRCTGESIPFRGMPYARPARQPLQLEAAAPIGNSQADIFLIRNDLNVHEAPT